MQTVRPEQAEGQEKNLDQLSFPIETSPISGGEILVVDFTRQTGEHSRNFEVDELAAKAREAATTQLHSLLSQEPHTVVNEPSHLIRPDFKTRQPELTGFSRALAPLTDALGVTGGGFRGRLIKREGAKRNAARSAAIPNIVA